MPGVVASTANDNQRTPGKDITENGTSYAIEKNESFRRLYALISIRKNGKSVYSVTATLKGAFLAGDPQRGSDGAIRYAGYGHLGCCSLFVITQVSDVDSIPPAHLDLSGVVLSPDGKPARGITLLNDADGGYPPVRQQTVTDNSGQFHFADAGQIIRIELPEYRPVGRLVDAAGSPVSIRLERAQSSDWIVPACSKNSTKNRVGFKALISLPSSMDAEYYKNDDEQTYFVYPKESSPPEAELIVEHDGRSGSLAGNGAGRESIWFSERWIKDSTGHVLGIDARGRDRNGIYFRSAVLGEHDWVLYGLNKKDESPSELDKIIDGLCITAN